MQLRALATMHRARLVHQGLILYEGHSLEGIGPNIKGGWWEHAFPYVKCVHLLLVFFHFGICAHVGPKNITSMF